MSMHTTGPWVALRSCKTERIIVLTPQPSKRVLLSFGSEGEPLDDADVANARLIAAAPDLLEALRITLKALDEIGSEMTVGERFTNAGQSLIDATPAARAAIAKATGEQQ